MLLNSFQYMRIKNYYIIYKKYWGKYPKITFGKLKRRFKIPMTLTNINTSISLILYFDVQREEINIHFYVYKYIIIHIHPALKI